MEVDQAPTAPNIDSQPLDLSYVLLASRPKRAEEGGRFVGHGGLGNANDEVRVEEMRIMRIIGMGFGMVVAVAMVAMAFRGFGAGGGLGRIPDFIGNWSNLKQLVLRNNIICDSIPSLISDNESLHHLFLGNNHLNGTLPAEKSPKLFNIDVSYNNLFGSLPSWIRQQNLQLHYSHNNETNIHNAIGAMCNNLVANNFNLESFNYNR
ncbi:hypothetical protein Pint_18591 [Pistacia integerrima]|uniref:Uncharacterized protein n=1 Tax=Pistacia integerrima TaxID=434235 RepID=A0ACC0YT92_9ROSI|nr:hypothetical protein Pint_18591 [Pistacia integerrima]